MSIISSIFIKNIPIDFVDYKSILYKSLNSYGYLKIFHFEIIIVLFPTCNITIICYVCIMFYSFFTFSHKRLECKSSKIIYTFIMQENASSVKHIQPSSLYPCIVLLLLKCRLQTFKTLHNTASAQYN